MKAEAEVREGFFYLTLEPDSTLEESFLDECSKRGVRVSSSGMTCGSQFERSRFTHLTLIFSPALNNKQTT